MNFIKPPKYPTIYIIYYVVCNLIFGRTEYMPPGLLVGTKGLKSNQMPGTSYVEDRLFGHSYYAPVSFTIPLNGSLAVPTIKDILPIPAQKLDFETFKKVLGNSSNIGSWSDPLCRDYYNSVVQAPSSAEKAKTADGDSVKEVTNNTDGIPSKKRANSFLGKETK